MSNWFVINTKPKKETQVERLFEEGGFTIYSPKHIVDGRVKPFFPETTSSALTAQVCGYSTLAKEILWKWAAPNLDVADQAEFREIMNEIKEKFPDIVRDYSILSMYSIEKLDFYPFLDAEEQKL